VITLAEGPEAVDLLDLTVALGQRARAGDERAADELARRVAELDLDEAEVLVRALTRWFQLVNLAEDNEGQAPAGPRSGRCRRGHRGR
jgi:phosphoenolpyruvate carboxylase